VAKQTADTYPQSLTCQIYAKSHKSLIDHSLVAGNMTLIVCHSYCSSHHSSYIHLMVGDCLLTQLDIQLSMAILLISLGAYHLVMCTGLN